MTGAELEYAAAAMRSTYAQLVTEPFCLSMAQVARLTDRQIAEIYCHQRDDKGAIVAPEPPKDEPERPPHPRGSAAEKAEWLAVCQMLGIPPAAAEEEWRRKRGE